LPPHQQAQVEIEVVVEIELASSYGRAAGAPQDHRSDAGASAHPPAADDALFHGVSHAPLTGSGESRGLRGAEGGPNWTEQRDQRPAAATVSSG